MKSQGTRYAWRDVPVDGGAVKSLLAADGLGLPEPIARLLASRGVTDPDSAREFLRPSLQQLGDPLEFPGMRAAAERIAAAVEARERIVIYGDFDADGVGACAILCGVLERLGADCGAFIPDRLAEGYGLSRAGWERCKAENPSLRLLVTVDCGITNIAEVAMVKSEGFDIVVTDHHTPGDELPRDCIVVNPCLGATPGADSLCGAGVAFKLAHALVKLDKEKRNLPAPAVDLREWLATVAISTIADVVPLRGENRALAAGGLNRLRKSPSPGLFWLMDTAGLPAEDVGGVSVAFRLCPRINAAGRIGSARDAYDLLRETDKDRARELAIRLKGRNAERQRIETGVVEAALEYLRQTGFDPARDGAAVAAGDDWHPGVIGIAAARVASEFGCPAAIISFDGDGNGRGSLRAGDTGDYDVHAAMQECAKHLSRFGGHRKAGGFGVRREEFDAFRAAFSAACLRQKAAMPSCEPELNIDLWLDPADATLEILSDIALLEPFGEGNREPVFALRGLQLIAPARRVGNEGMHLQAVFRCGDSALATIGFGLGLRVRELAGQDQRFDIAGTLCANTFNGSTNLQMSLRDFRPSPA